MRSKRRHVRAAVAMSTMTAAAVAVLLSPIHLPSSCSCWAFHVPRSKVRTSTLLTSMGGLLPTRISSPRSDGDSSSLQISSGNDDDERSPSGNSVNLFELDEDTFSDDGENVVGSKFFGGSAVKDELYVAEEEERAVELQMSSGNDDDERSPSGNSVNLFELDEDTFSDDGENVVGSKFFGGSAVKDELYVAEEEERAVELQRVVDTEYDRFEDGVAFVDDLARRVGRALQESIRGVLNDAGNDGGSGASGKITFDPSFVWTTPFASSKGGVNDDGQKRTRSTPLTELAISKLFYRKLDVAILSGRSLPPASDGGNSAVEIRWDIGALWPNPWESRVLLSGTSVLTIREGDSGGDISIARQVDRLDGNDPTNVIGRLASQLFPRFWDLYHIGMTPSAELDTRLPPFTVPSIPSSSGMTKNEPSQVSKKKGPFSKYKLHHVPPRLTIRPSMIDFNGRSGRAAQTLPNHAFTTAIKTMGPNKQNFAPVSPVEVTIVKVAKTSLAKSADGGSDGDGTVGEKKKAGGSLITWSVPVPPEFASNSILPLPVIDDGLGDDEDGDVEDASVKLLVGTNDDDATPTSPYNTIRGQKPPPPSRPLSTACRYELRPHRLVATLPYSGSTQDKRVSEIRRELYRQVVEQDGFSPKLDPDTGRPAFFFWMNDTKACFTKKGGLGMAVYEWRPDFAESNEVGLELEYSP